MQTLSKIVVMAAAWLLTTNVGAVTVVECVDAEGNSSFRSACPPGTTKKGEKHLRGTRAPEEPGMATEDRREREVILEAGVVLIVLPGGRVRERLGLLVEPIEERARRLGKRGGAGHDGPS